MDCPKCKKPMRVKNTQGIEIDECADCKGTWFDRDELRRVKDHTNGDLNWMDFELWKHPERFRVAEKPVGCPRCAVSMVSIEYDKTRVEVDYCIQCRGVWLDADEFEKIIEALTQELESKGVSDYIRASLEEVHEIVAGTEGFFSEWRDFTTVMRMLRYRILADHPRLHSLLTAMQANSPARS